MNLSTPGADRGEMPKEVSLSAVIWLVMKSEVVSSMLSTSHWRSSLIEASSGFSEVS